MTIEDELGYRHRPVNKAQRVVQSIAASRPGAWIFQRTLHPVDRALFRVTKGRATVPGLLAGLPVIMVTTTGRKSGKPRTMPLLSVPLDGGLAVIGSNFGQEHTPGWVYNLEADPTATVGYRDRTVTARARLADDEVADEAFRVAAAVYPGYGKYRERAGHRTIKVFILETDGEGQ